MSWIYVELVHNDCEESADKMVCPLPCLVPHMRMIMPKVSIMWNLDDVDFGQEITNIKIVGTKLGC